jgi:AbrB family looped-hinge helix DNA binding protein
LKIQVFQQTQMTELRKVLRLTKNAYAVTIPSKYRDVLKLGPGNYLEISLVENETLIIKKHKEPEKP